MHLTDLTGLQWDGSRHFIRFLSHLAFHKGSVYSIDDAVLCNGYYL